LVAMGGNLGMDVDLGLVPVDHADRDDVILFSESAGRFIVTIDPDNKGVFEDRFRELPCACIGTVTEDPVFKIKGIAGKTIVDLPVGDLKAAWKGPFGDLV